MTYTYSYLPEDLGLTVVSEACDPTLSWEFDMFTVWQDADGKLYYAQDSGCSCPSPYEDVRKLDDLTEYTDWATFVADLDAWAGQGWRDDDKTARQVEAHELKMLVAGLPNS